MGACRVSDAADGGLGHRDPDVVDAVRPDPQEERGQRRLDAPAGPRAKITKLKDGRTHLAHQAEQAVDLKTGAVVGVTVQDADAGDTTTLVATVITAAEQLETVRPAADAVRELVADKEYHSNQILVELAALRVCTYISEPRVLPDPRCDAGAGPRCRALFARLSRWKAVVYEWESRKRCPSRVRWRRIEELGSSDRARIGLGGTVPGLFRSRI